MATKTTKTVKVSKTTPSTMDELLASVGYKLKGFRRGEVVVGIVKEVTAKTMYVDIGGKAVAVVAEREYELSRDYFKSLKTGDEVTGTVLVAENDAGQVVLSLRKAAAESRWKHFEEALAADSIMTVKVKESTKGGLLVDAEGVIGFVPTSQLSKEIEGDVANLVDRNLQVKVIEVDREQNRLVMSEKAVSEAEEIASRKKALSVVELNGEYDGVIMGMVPFGAFVEIKVGKGAKAQTLEGLVHISEVSWEKVDEVSKVFKDGDKVKVKVIGVDEENGKLALSVKRLSSDPWSVVAEKFKIDTNHAGVVSKIAPYGVLVRLEKGIEGLIHASKMPVDRSFKEGDKVDVFVESVDLSKRRLSLGVVLTAKPVGYK